ncbi:zinc-ribbon domain-containing protein [Heliobacillus mobilis]|uniref:Zinc-ribbon domain-containing protein n=1 Tax=Heliobacterium mobile TaxID=28064 RepID=A0A6I3SIY5_HELMO|nr:zinc ribbon domain-containing protein [Heliobacterium mobile]MTV48851.1 zinc-ribbon domain-containing protein [Heliobacterium mobile]
MGLYETTKIVPVSLSDLTPVANDVLDYFRAQEYDVNGEGTPTRGWHISISKGGIFKAVLGMKTALNIEIEPTRTGTSLKAGIGIFGMQAIPTVIALFVAWPVLLTQIWGLVKNADLDEEAINCAEKSLLSQATHHSASKAQVDPSQTFCTNCGHRLQSGDKFCPQCGTRR